MHHACCLWNVIESRDYVVEWCFQELFSFEQWLSGSSWEYVVLLVLLNILWSTAYLVENLHWEVRIDFLPISTCEERPVVVHSSDWQVIYLYFLCFLLTEEGDTSHYPLCYSDNSVNWRVRSKGRGASEWWKGCDYLVMFHFQYKHSITLQVKFYAN